MAAAEHRFGSDPRFVLKASTDPNDVLALDGTFDVGICMETFEHIPSASLDAYVAAVAAKVKGAMLITVPNEKGAALLFKTTAAMVLRRNRDIGYKRGEWINSILGRMDRVEHKDHKGFDYAKLAGIVGRHFRSVKVEGIGPKFMPTSCQLTIGIIAKT
ncbi:MAG TPA: hypothetical protein VIM11_15165 [Tepidisphaeraceae bacterium]